MIGGVVASALPTNTERAGRPHRSSGRSRRAEDRASCVHHQGHGRKARL